MNLLTFLLVLIVYVVIISVANVYYSNIVNILSVSSPRLIKTNYAYSTEYFSNNLKRLTSSFNDSNLLSSPFSYTNKPHQISELSSKLSIEPFESHPFHYFTSYNGGRTLEKVMAYLSQDSACLKKPIFLTMARVTSDVYWQLIENFFYTM